MKPKEKAKQLVDKYFPLCSHINPLDKAKQCALIAVDELMYAAIQIDHMQKSFIEIDEETWQQYWVKVKKEIENIYVV